MVRHFAFLVLFLAGCATAPRPPDAPPRVLLEPIAWPDDSPALELAVLNRVGWGANHSSSADIARLGTGRWLDAQLHPAPARLPAAFAICSARRRAIRRCSSTSTTRATAPAASTRTTRAS